MKMELMILAKSDKNNGYCVMDVKKFGYSGKSRFFLCF